MSDHILVSIAWPYANSHIHVGNITGSHLPGDIFARYHRLKGNRVLMVSGSDSHGTPVSVKADAEGKTSLEVYQRFHASFLGLFIKLGISYDLFTSTHRKALPARPLRRRRVLHLPLPQRARRSVR